MTTKPPGWVSKTPATTKTKRPASRRPPGLVEHSPAKATRAKSPRRPAAKPPRTTDDAILTQIRLAQLTGSTDDDTKAVSGGTGQLIDISGGGGSVTKQGVISTGVKATDLDGLAADSLGAPDGAAELDGDGVLSSPLPDSVATGTGVNGSLQANGADVTSLALPWLVVDGNQVREGTGGSIYRATGYNIHVAVNEYTSAQTLTAAQMDRYFGQAIRPNSLSRLRAYAPPSASGVTWDQALTNLDTVVAKARQHGQRLIFCLTSWNTVDATADAFAGKNAAWLTNQTYLESVSGDTSFQTWVNTVVARYANDSTVCIYDVCNEPYITTNTTDVQTWVDTTRGWIQALAPQALVYVGIDLVGSVGGAANYETINTSMDLCSAHDYDSYGFLSAGWASVTAARALSKPQIFDEIGVWAKAHYGTSGDSDLDDTGWPAVDYLAQGQIFEQQIASTLSLKDVMGVLAYSYMDSDGGGFTDGLGHYQPVNDSPARKAILTVPLDGQPFSADTLTNLANYTWADGAQALRYAPGAAMTTYHERGSLVDYSQSVGPLAGRFNGFGSFQFDGSHALDISNRLDAGDAASTRAYAFAPTALPASGAYGYLFGPQTAVAQAAIRINSAGKIELVHYAAATTGTVIGTSTNTVTLSAVNVLCVTWSTSGGAWEINLNGVATTGTTTATLTASPTTGRIGAADDGTNGLVGHVLESIQERIADTATNRGLILSYFQRKYLS